MKRNNSKGRKTGNILITIGLLLVAAALFLTIFNLWDSARAEKAAKLAARQLKESSLKENLSAKPGELIIPDYMLNPDMDMPAVEVDGYRYIGTISIPSLELELPVMEEWSDTKLRKAPCRYSGSAYLDNMVIAAHNYRNHFGRLKNIAMGEEVIFTDNDGNLFRYEAAEMETLGKYDVEEMTSGDWDLTLFTCTYGGKSRVTLRCLRIQ